ncbi:MAG: hypothetical protein GY940_24385 [bacterium]|nr:hypothetical protein [bacterium]
MKKKKDNTVPGVENGNPAAVSTRTIDPTPYRTNLEQIEALIYAEHQPTYKDATAIQAAVNSLAKRFTNGNPMIRKRGFSFLTYGESVGGETDVGIGMISATSRRRWVDEWEQLVKTQFQPADWLRGSLARETVDGGSLLTDMQDLMINLENMVSTAETEMTDFGQNAVNLQNINQADASTRLDNWRMWADNWVSQVDSSAEDLPDGLNVPQKMRPGFENIEFAIRRMKEVPNPGPGVFLGGGDERLNALYLPAMHMRTAWLKDILRIIKQARQFLDIN